MRCQPRSGSGSESQQTLHCKSPGYQAFHQNGDATKSQHEGVCRAAKKHQSQKSKNTQIKTVAPTHLCHMQTWSNSRVQGWIKKSRVLCAWSNTQLDERTNANHFCVILRKQTYYLSYWLSHQLLKCFPTHCVVSPSPTFVPMA